MTFKDDVSIRNNQEKKLKMIDRFADVSKDFTDE
jgi:hypothetical protein